MYFLNLPIPQIKMVERPKLAAVCGRYDYYYAGLDLFRERAHGSHCHHAPQKECRVKENCNQEENHRPLPQW